MKVISIIPARGGSKGIPRKNLLRIKGRTLVEWAISVGVGDILVSTDDEEIAGVAAMAGAEIVWRPAELATDEARTIDAVSHALEGRNYDFAVLLQPSNPLRMKQDVENCLSILDLNMRKWGVDSVVSVCKVTHFHPQLMKRIRFGYLLSYTGCCEIEGTRRQDYSPEAYMRTGAIYVATRKTIEGGSLLGTCIVPYIMPEHSYGIDCKWDIQRVEEMISDYS